MFRETERKGEGREKEEGRENLDPYLTPYTQKKITTHKPPKLKRAHRLNCDIELLENGRKSWGLGIRLKILRHDKQAQSIKEKNG